jgi:hypothetical protein
VIGRVSGSALNATTGTFRRKACPIGSKLAAPYDLPLASLSPTLRAPDDETFLAGIKPRAENPCVCACGPRSMPFNAWHALCGSDRCYPLRLLVADTAKEELSWER